jgi:hypothetical protein
MAGLDNNERCIWIASSPLPSAEIGTEIAKRPVLKRGAASGQLQILDAPEWYGKLITLTPEQLVQRCLDEEEQALADGHEGLRISGNTTLLARTDWHHLMEYEMRLHDRLRTRRIVACCSYNRVECAPVDMLEVARCHDAAVDRSEAYWELLVRTSPQVHGRHLRS